MYFRHEIEKIFSDKMDPVLFNGIKKRLDYIGDVFDDRYLNVISEVIKETTNLEFFGEDAKIYANAQFVEDCYSRLFPDLNIGGKMFRSYYLISRVQFYIETRMAQKYGVEDVDDLENSENMDARNEYNEYQDWSEMVSEKESIITSYLACVLDGEDDEYEDLFE
jgi:hypothetical protein